MEDKTYSHNERSDARDVVLDLNFVPQWARKSPGENHYSKKEYREPRRRDDRPRRDGPRPEGRGDSRPRRPQPDRRDERRGERSERPEGRREPREPIKELPLSVSFLPEQKRLASLVRQIHHTRRAFPLMDLANLLIHDSEGYLVKIEGNKETPDFVLFQCKKCKAVTSTEALMTQHVMSKHLMDVYEKEEIQAEPPAGNFPGVARCRKTGLLLGPPNHHSYNAKVAEVHSASFAHLTLDDYKRTLEIVKDEELVEQWKEESRKQTVYKLKADPDAEPVDRKRAENDFAKKVPSLFERTHRAVVPSKISQSLEDRDITHAIKRVWGKESRFPLSMSFAMRAAFRHMHLYLFKAGKINFVTHIKPNPVNPADTVSNIAEVLLFLKENAGSTRMHLLEVLHPGVDPQSQEAKDALQPLGWLIERGHIIEFFNGTLSTPLGRRRR
ncbi:MAG: hypothetical protein V5783_12580 [Pontiella sp.]